MLAQFAKTAVGSLGLRVGASALVAESSPALQLLATRGYAKVVDGLKYAKDHEWVKVEGDVATIGITDHAQSELGDVVYAELPEVGSTSTKGERLAIVESVKAASDIVAPISGEVLEVNEALVNDASQINSDPYGAWFAKVKLSNKADLEELMDAKAYEDFCA